MSIASHNPYNLLYDDNFSDCDSLSSASTEDNSYPDILFLGGGNFSFEETFVHRRTDGIGINSGTPRPNFASRVLVTEYKSREDCLAIDGVAERIDSLEALGVNFLYNVDAQNIDKTFEGREFTRIQWNGPDIHTGFCDHQSNLPYVLRGFAVSASKLQGEGHTLHFSLIAPEKQPDYAVWQGLHYDITSAIEGSGYTLYAIKDSGPNRYFHEKGTNTYQYTHQKTADDGIVSAFEEGVNELIFRRTLDPSARTSSNYIGTVVGYQKVYSQRGGAPKRVQVEKPYYCMDLRSPLSSDSNRGDSVEDMDVDIMDVDIMDMEIEMNVEDDVFEEVPVSEETSEPNVHSNKRPKNQREKVSGNKTSKGNRN